MHRVTVLLLAGLLLPGCWAFLAGSSESRALDVLKDYRSKVEQPMAVPEVRQDPVPHKGVDLPDVITLTLDSALSLALGGNRDFLSRKEDLYLEALSLASVRYTWDPQLATTISYLFLDTKREGAVGASQGTISGSITQKLPLGGSASVSGSTSAYTHHADKVDRSATTSFSFEWDQPLLRGFGPDPAMESLIQARRHLLYELRDFELYRQEFCIDTLSRFFNLVRQADQLKNSERNFATFRDAYNRARALFDVDRVPEIDVFRAEREFEQARNDLEVARDSYEQALDLYKVFLGLPSATTITVDVPDWVTEALDAPKPEGEAERLPFALSECVRVAIENRLDLKTVHDRLEDAGRAVSVAGNDMLPDLDFNLRFSLDHDPVQDYNKQVFDRHIEAGLSLGIPWDFRPEHDAYFRARVTEERTRRARELAQEQVRREIRDLYRRANQARLSIHIQNKIRFSARARLKIAQFRFKEGEISNRDVIEATDALLIAENRYIQSVIDRRLRDLDLARAMGILKVDGKGRPDVMGWSETGLVVDDRSEKKDATKNGGAPPARETGNDE